MIQSDGELLWQAHCKGFIPWWEAIETERYLQSKLGTGAEYGWVDRHGNQVDFGSSGMSETKVKKVSKFSRRGDLEQND
jgi:hypothetical protein